MLDMILRLVVAGGLLIGTAYLPTLGAGEHGTSAPTISAEKTFRACPTRGTAAVKACIA